NGQPNSLISLYPNVQWHIMYILAHLDFCVCTSGARMKIEIIHFESLDTRRISSTDFHWRIMRWHSHFSFRFTRSKTQHTYHHQQNCSTPHNFPLLFLTSIFPHRYHSHRSSPMLFPIVLKLPYYCRI